MPKQLKITKVRSTISTSPRQRQTLQGLGLRKIGQSVLHHDNPQIRGMIRAVSHLVKWEEVQNG